MVLRKVGGSSSTIFDLFAQVGAPIPSLRLWLRLGLDWGRGMTAFAVAEELEWVAVTRQEENEKEDEV